MRTIVLVTPAVLALAACQKAPGAASGALPTKDANASTSATPQRRAGLWEQSFSRDSHEISIGSMRLCVDPTSEARASVFSRGAVMQRMPESHCTASTTSRGVGGSYSFSSTCPMIGGGTIITKGVTSGDFSTTYHVHIESDVRGAAYAAMNGHHATDIDGKWLGPCPAGMTPGDMEFGHMRVSGGKLAGAAAALTGGGGQ
jgi:hypothetical protein